MRRLGTFVEVLAATLVLGVVLGALEGALATPRIGEPWTQRVLAVVVVDLALAGGLGLVLGALAALLPRDRPLTAWTRAASGVPVFLVALVAFALYTGRDTLEAELGAGWTSELPLPRIASPGARPVVLVTLDTTRADALDHMPRLAARAQDGLVYERASSTAPWTLPAMASLHTGLPVHETGAGRRAPDGPNHLRSGLADDVPLLAERLRSRGYVTAAVITNPYLGPRYGFHRGFDRFHDVTRAALLSGALRRSLVLRQVLPAVDERQVFPRAAEQLPALVDGHGFLWVHAIEAHAPYEATEDDGPCELPRCFGDWGAVRKGGPEPDRALVRELYEADLRREDEALDRFLSQVPANVLVLVTADHGEEFWEHGGFEHGRTFDDEVIRVPLVVLNSGRAPGRVERHVDLLGVHEAIVAWADGGDLGPLEPDGPDAQTPLASILFGPEASACTDGHTLWLESECAPGPLPENDGRLPEDLTVLRSLGYVD